MKNRRSPNVVESVVLISGVCGSLSGAAHQIALGSSAELVSDSQPSSRVLPSVLARYEMAIRPGGPAALSAIMRASSTPGGPTGVGGDQVAPWFREIDSTGSPEPPMPFADAVPGALIQAR